MREKVTVGKIWSIIYPMLVYTLITQIVGTIYIMVQSIMITAAEKPIAESVLETRLMTKLEEQTLMIMLVSALVTLPLLILFMHRDIKKDKENNTYKKYKSLFGVKYLLIVPFALFFMYGANAFVSIFVLLMPQSMIDTYEYTRNAIYGSSVVMQLMAGAIVCPIVEELIFRGLIYKRIKKMAGMTAAAVISSLIFGIYHGNWIQAPYAFLIGLASVYVYERYKSIAAPILMHISSNSFSLIISQIAISQGKNTEVYTMKEQMISYALVTLVTGFMAYAVSRIINKTVNPKEIIEK